MTHLEVREDLGDFRDAWEALVCAADPINLAFLPWWLESLEMPSTRYLLVFDQGELLGGFPVDLQFTYFRRPLVPVIRLPGKHPYMAAHADVLAVPGAEEIVARAIARWFSSHRQAIVSLEGVKEGSTLERCIPRDVKNTTEFSAPYVLLPNSYTAYIQGRSRNFRRGLQQNQRRIEEAGFLYRQLGLDDLDLGLREIRRLHQVRFGDESEFIPRFHMFEVLARAGATVGEFSFHALVRDEHFIAIEAVFEKNGYAEDFQGGWDPTDPAFRGAGTVLVAKIIEDGCRRGLRQLDLSYPASDYKLRFTDAVRSVRNLHSTWGWAPRWVPRGRRLLRSPALARAALRRRRSSPD